MRIRTAVVSGVLAAALLALTPALASAQDKKIHINIGGGPTFMFGDLGDDFGIGWGPAFGVTWDLNKKMAVQFEYAYRYFPVSDNLPINATKFSANHQTHQLAFDFVGSLNGADAKARVYVIAGPGAYHRTVEITHYEGTGVICDPFYFICGAYPVGTVVGSRGGWDFGFNVGGGVGFKLGEASEFFIETRYHYVAGPDFSSPGIPVPHEGQNSSTGNYMPLTFGIRF